MTDETKVPTTPVHTPTPHTAETKPVVPEQAKVAEEAKKDEAPSHPAHA